MRYGQGTKFGRAASRVLLVTVVVALLAGTGIAAAVGRTTSVHRGSEGQRGHRGRHLERQRDR